MDEWGSLHTLGGPSKTGPSSMKRKNYGQPRSGLQCSEEGESQRRGSLGSLGQGDCAWCFPGTAGSPYQRLHRKGQLESSVGHCMVPNWVPLSFRCPLPPHRTFHCHPRQSGATFPAWSQVAARSWPNIHTCTPALGPWSQLNPVLSSASPAQLKLRVFKTSKEVFLKRISTFPHLSLVQGLSRWTHESPNSSPSPSSALSNLLQTTATCNLFQGWSVHCSLLLKCPQCPPLKAALSVLCQGS